MKKLIWYAKEVTKEFPNHDLPTLKVKLTYKKAYLHQEEPTFVIASPDLDY